MAATSSFRNSIAISVNGKRIVAEPTRASFEVKFPCKCSPLGRALGMGESRLLDCLPAMQHDPNRPEDVLKVDADEEGVGGDDAADA